MSSSVPTLMYVFQPRARPKSDVQYHVRMVTGTQKQARPHRLCVSTFTQKYTCRPPVAMCDFST
eukprot:11038-Eustigmatos_ZCMA.PRE.1